MEIPWWSEPVTGVPGPLREKVPAKTALRYQVVPLQEDERDQYCILRSVRPAGATG